ELGTAVGELLQDPERAADLGRRAKACAEAQTGATTTAVLRIVQLHAEAVPRFEPIAPVSAAMGLYCCAASAARVFSRRVTLNAPVISVGNLTMGGSGKTPMDLYLAQRLSKPAILTRGYRRQSGENLILAAGADVSWKDTGDEAHIFLRSGLAPVGIGAERAEVG